MFQLLILLSTLTGSDAGRLGDPDWRTREGAETRLRLAGVFALPAVWPLRESDNPEVRHRAARLLGPWVAWAADLRAAAVLTDPWPVDELAFYHDERLRRRVQRMAVAAGCPTHITGDLTPAECLSWWAWTRPSWAASAAALARCKAHLGVPVAGWPFQ